MPLPDLHFFVCTNRRPEGHPRGCCADKGGEAVLQAFDSELLGAQGAYVKLTETGCLGPCSQGTVVVVYPHRIWYGGVTPEDAAEIVKTHLDAPADPRACVGRLVIDEDWL